MKKTLLILTLLLGVSACSHFNNLGCKSEDDCGCPPACEAKKSPCSTKSIPCAKSCNKPACCPKKSPCAKPCESACDTTALNTEGPKAQSQAVAQTSAPTKEYPAVAQTEELEADDSLEG